MHIFRTIDLDPEFVYAKRETTGHRNAEPHRDHAISALILAKKTPQERPA